jgi:hypothetical protein
MTDKDIEEAAQKIHLERSSEAAKFHRQNTVPWGKLGETVRESYRREVRDRQAARE